MRIFFSTYQAVNFLKGGITYKVIQLKKALSELGIDVQFFKTWDFKQKFGQNDLFHLFNADIGSYHLAQSLKNSNLRYVVNPIFFNRHQVWKIRSYRKLESVARFFLKGLLSDFQITRKICDDAEMILPNTEAEKEILCNGLDLQADKMQVIENGVEERFAEADLSLFQKKFGIKDFILFVGHLGAARKNCRKIIRALENIDHPSVIIADVINNPEGKWCESEITKNPKMLLLKWIDHYDPILASAYAACHTFILPTLYETPGRAALEAGLAGANIVITPFGGTKEYFLDLAEYPDPSSIQSIQKAIEKSLDKKQNELLKQHIMDNFIWQKIAAKTSQIYQKVLLQ